MLKANEEVKDDGAEQMDDNSENLKHNETEPMDEEVEELLKTTEHVEEIEVQVQPMDDGLDKDLLKATMSPKTGADLVAEKHIEWSKKKEAEVKKKILYSKGEKGNIKFP